jgi:hypothetical protein
MNNRIAFSARSGRPVDLAVVDDRAGGKAIHVSGTASRSPGSTRWRAVRRLLVLIVSCRGIAAETVPATEPTVCTVSNEQMRIDTSRARVVANGTAWKIVAPMLDDNGDTSLPADFRRWWHFQIDGLDAVRGTTLIIEITNAGYDDVITPVWSLDAGHSYDRISGVVPHVASGTHTFTIQTPVGIPSIRLAKYFPYTSEMQDAFRASLAGLDVVRDEVIGRSCEGRDITMLTLTDTSVPDLGKRRVWIQSAVHPGETPAIFACEGLVSWFVGGGEARAALEEMIVNVVLLPNPDGIALGNYRTTAKGVNLEVQWSAPYDSEVPEIVALRSTIERFMGTPTAPAGSPICLLLNLHASHGGGHPFHFVHKPSYPPTGVIPEVRELEDHWVATFKRRSAFGALRETDPESTLAGRGYLESMMHDRYTLQSPWAPVMAITFEGTYEEGPTPGVPNSPADYRRLGAEMAAAIVDTVRENSAADTFGTSSEAVSER